MLKFLLSVEQEEVGDSVSEMMVLASCSTENSLLMTGVKIASCSSSASIATGTAIAGFVECTVPLYSPSEYTSHFRMSRESVQVNIIFTGRIAAKRQSAGIVLLSSQKSTFCPLAEKL